MRKYDDEIYQLAKDQALVKKLKNKRFRPFCLCLPGVMFVTRGSKNSLCFVFDSLSNLDCGYKFWICQSHPMSAPATQSVDSRQERLFRKVTSVSIHSFVEWLDTFSYVLRHADVTVKEVNQIT